MKALLFALTVAHAGPPVPDGDRLIADVRALSGVDPLGEAPVVSRHVAHPDHDRVGDWLVAELRSIEALEVREEPFDGPEPGTRNLVADLPGSDPDLPWLVVGAHWDSTASAEAAWDPTADPAPGADDDASGTAAVLELARRFAGSRWEASIRFALFDAEEQGLVGSEAMAAAMAARGEEVGLMWSMDPIGYNHDGGGFLWVTYDARWQAPARDLEALAPQVAPTLSVTALDRDLIGGATRSDHASFWEQGFPALHVASWPQPPTYHTMADTVDNVDPAFLEATTTLVAAHLAAEAVAVREAPPAAGCGCTHAQPAGAGWLAALALALRRRGTTSRRARRP